MQPKEIEINLPSGKLAALTWGPKSGFTILAAHGWLDNAASFIPLAKYLSKDLRIIAIDLPGHGYSEHRPAGTYFHFVDYILDFIVLLEHLKLDKCALLGHSLGAAIFACVAGTIPERITHLGLLDALGPFPIEEQNVVNLVRSGAFQYLRLATKKLPKYENVEQAINARLKATFMERQSVELIIDRGLQKIGQYFTWRTDPRLLLKPLFMYTEPQIEIFLQQITAPTCLIRPELGWPFSEEIFHSRSKCVKNLVIHKIPGGHHAHMDQPQISAKILNDFFTVK